MRLRVSAPWVVTALATTLAALGLVGTDIRWMVPLGRLVAHGHPPGSIPSATAPSAGWHDAPAIGELVVWALYSLGNERALLVLQVAAVAVAWTLLAWGLRRQGSSAGATGLTGFVAIAACAPLLVTTRVWLFSLVLFPALLLLLQDEARRPSARIWLAVPLLAVWTNLHGGALVGWVVLLAYLVCARLRHDARTAVLVAAAGTLALLLTPVLWNTPAYYREALQNEAARRGTGLWGPLEPHGFGLVMIAAALVLVALAVRGRLQPWEWVVLAALAAGTIDASRFLPYLAFAAAYPAARGLPVRRGLRQSVANVAFVVLVAATAVALVLNPLDAGSPSLARQAAETGRPVLADALLTEQVQLYGGRVWIGNPLDAFDPSDQKLWLDWIEGKPGGERAVDHAELVLVEQGSDPGRAAARDARLKLVRADGEYALYRVV